MNPLQLLNPLGAFIDLGAKLSGLPPGAVNGLKIATGAVTGNLLSVVEGASGLASAAAQGRCPSTEYLPRTPAKDGTAEPGYAASQLSEAKERAEALRVLKRSFDKAEVAGAFWKTEDGLLGKGDLEALSGDPRVSAELKRAARYLLDHPEAFTELAQTRVDAPFPVVQLLISRSDLEEGLERAEKAVRDAPGPVIRPPVKDPPPTTRPPTKGPGSGGGARCGGAGSGEDGLTLRDVLDDPRLSAEEKIQAILWLVMENLDEEMVSAGEELDHITDERKGLTPDDTSKDADLKRGAEKMEHRLQTLVQKRQAMFELLTNLTLKQGEMAMRALSNLAR